tara:strand:+ start:1218 stop:1547 length:330 start_codon:yes stop_codon:yes gene_type:complete
MKQLTLAVLFLISTNIAASEIFLKCDYDNNDKWIKLTADKNKDIGSMERSNGYSQRCDVTFTSSYINWSCKNPYADFSQPFNVDRENLEFDNGEFKLGKCRIVETKNVI